MNGTSILNTVKKISLGLALSAVGFHVNAAEKFGTVDAQELFNTAPQAVAAKKRINDKLQTKKDSIEKKQLEFKQKNERYGRDKDVFSNQEKKQQEKQLQELRNDLDTAVQNFEMDSAEIQSQEMENLMKTFKEVVATIAKKEELDFVLPAHLPIYVKEGHDITDKTLKALEQLNPKK